MDYQETSIQGYLSISKKNEGPPNESSVSLKEENRGGGNIVKLKSSYIFFKKEKHGNNIMVHLNLNN